MVLSLKKKGEKHGMKKKLDAYDLEEAKLHEVLAKLDGGTDEYEKAQKQLKEINIMRKEHRESKGKMSPSDKAGLWRKILGGGVTIGGVCLLSHYEAKGNIFSGEKKSFADGFTKVLCRFFGGGD